MDDGEDAQCWHQLQTAMAAHYYHCAKADELTKRIATLWKAFTDEQPADAEDPKRLNSLYMESLDAGKAEKLPQIPHDLTKKRLPPHLWKSGAGFGAARQAPAHASCAHKSALLRMFEAVLTGSITGAEPPPSCPEMWLDPDLAVYVSGPGSAPFLSDAKHVELERKWEQLLSRYGNEMSSLIESEDLKNDPGSYARLMSGFRHELLNGRSPEVPCDELLAEASVVYRTIYQNRQNQTCGHCVQCSSASPPKRVRKFTFVWNVCGDLLLHLKQRNRNSGTGRAPMAVDAARLRTRLRPRRRRKEPVEPVEPQMDDGEDAQCWHQLHHNL